MFKKFIKDMANRMAYARMVQVLSSMDDKQLKDIGIVRGDIPAVARQSLEY